MSRTLNKVTKESLEKTPFEKRGVSCDQDLSRVPQVKISVTEKQKSNILRMFPMVLRCL